MPAIFRIQKDAVDHIHTKLFLLHRGPHVNDMVIGFTRRSGKHLNSSHTWLGAKYMLQISKACTELCGWFMGLSFETWDMLFLSNCP